MEQPPAPSNIRQDFGSIRTAADVGDGVIQTLLAVMVIHVCHRRAQAAASSASRAALEQVVLALPPTSSPT